MAKKRKSQEQLQPKQEQEEESEEEDSSEEEEEEEEEEEDDDDDDDGEEEDSSEEENSSEEEEDSSEDADEADNEDDSEASKRETIRKLLQPFGKDQIIALLKEAADSNPATLSKILPAVESDPVHRKIFVHGLGWDATNETLTSAFKQYGQIEECNVVTDKITGRSKGYGFVLFKTRSGARKALKQPQKKIGNRMAACHLAAAGPSGSNPAAGADVNERRLYVGNVGPQISAEKLRTFFAKFGEIEDGPLGFDKATGKFRGFAIIVFKTAEGMKKALEEPVKTFESCKLQCSRKVAKTTPVQQQAVAGSTGATLPPSNYQLQAYQMGLNQGLIGQNVNPQGVLVGQNQAVGILNPVLGAAAALNQPGLSQGFAGGLSQPVNRAPPVGLSAGFGPQLGMNSINPGVLGAYGSPAAFQGLGAYQSSQLGQSPASAAAAGAGRPHPGVGSVGTLPSYFGR